MSKLEIKVYLKEREWETRELTPAFPWKEMKFWNVNKSWKHYTQQNKPDTKAIQKNTVWFHRCETSGVGKVMVTDGRIRGCRRHRARENGELLINGTEILSGWQKMFGNRWDSCTKLWMESIPLSSTLKVVKIPNFILDIFCHDFKNKKCEVAKSMELYPQNGWILWHVNYISRKL